MYQFLIFFVFLCLTQLSQAGSLAPGSYLAEAGYGNLDVTQGKNG